MIPFELWDNNYMLPLLIFQNQIKEVTLLSDFGTLVTFARKIVVFNGKMFGYFISIWVGTGAR